MSQYADLLTAAVFEVIKDGRSEQFEGDFRDAFLKSADKLRLDWGQKNNFRPTVRNRVKERVKRYQAKRPQLLLELVVPPAPPSPPPTPPTPMPDSFRQWSKDFKAKQAAK